MKNIRASLQIFFVALICLSAISCNKSANVVEKVSASATTADSKDPDIAETMRLIERAPDSPVGYVQLGAVYAKRARETGDFSLNSKAETAVDKALQMSPEDASARKLKASLHLTFHRFAEALAAGEKLKTEFPADSFVYGVLTDSNLELGNYEAAVDSAQKMVDLKPNSTSYARVAHLRSMYGDHAGAVEMYKTAARTTDPQDREALSWCLVQLGDEFWKNGKYAEAEKVYDEALQIFPKYYLATAGKGRARLSQNDVESAITLLNEANAKVPSVEVSILLGDIHTKQGDADTAKHLYELVEMIEGKTGVNNDQKRLAILWADHDRNLEQALAITTRETELRKDIFTADAFAWSLYKNGRLTDAKVAITRALNPKSNDARIIFHAGMIEKDLGNRAEAKRLLETALRINPMFDLLQADVARRSLAELK